jgi:uncharacterized protein
MREMQPTVERLSVAAVKGTAIRHPSRVHLGVDGAVDDRRYLVVNADRELITPRRAPGLLLLRATLERPPDPDSTRNAGDGAREVWLSLRFPSVEEVSGRAEPGPVEPARVWDREVPARNVDGPFSAALSHYLGTSARLIEVLRPEHAQDSAPVTIISSASIEELGRMAGLSDPIDPRRFRMTIELAGCEPFQEESWSGRRIRVGSAVLQIGGRVPRCLVTTLDPDTGEKNLDVLKLLARHRPRGEDGLPLGMYADVMLPGTVAVGDAVRMS